MSVGRRWHCPSTMIGHRKLRRRPGWKNNPFMFLNLWVARTQEPRVVQHI